MNNISQGLIIMLVGMGGTLLSLGFLIFVINTAKRVLPYVEEPKKGVDVAGDAPGKEKV